MDIPFHSNTGDGTHCFQAVLRMALAKFRPSREYSYEFLDGISQKKHGKWTWPTAAMIWLMDEGFEVKLIEEFDYRAFVEKGEDYLIWRYGEEVGRAQIENSDIDFELGIARRFVDIAPVEYRVPGLGDIEDEMKLGSVVIVNLNVAGLYGLTGYSGHFVVVCEVGSDRVRLHDPGLPPRPNCVVTAAAFDAAWGYPSDRDKNLLSIRLP